jgi:hypothetical protein
MCLRRLRPLSIITSALALLAAVLGLGACSREPPFTRDGNTWRYRGHVLDVDAASFQPLGAHHGRDASRVIHVDTTRSSSDYFTTARLRVRTLHHADPTTLVLLDDDHARDRNRVWYEGQPVVVRHAGSFELLGDGFARDREQGYYLRSPVAGSHGMSFRAIGTRHAGDERQAWYCDTVFPRDGSPVHVACRVLAGADPDQVTLLEHGYAVSGSHVYHRGSPVAGADAASFSTLPGLGDEADAQDAGHRYREGRRIANPP